MIRTWIVRSSVVSFLAFGLFAPLEVFAQQASGIAGVTRDTSGAVLPGVTVEAASPALIEKVRTVVTDAEGRYNITDLRPGTYAVTFTLAGFSSFKRDGVVLTAGFSATVNADMQLGAREETITVSGVSPLVDVQNSRQQASVSNELLAALPSGSKAYMSIARIIPGMTGNVDSGGASGLYSANSAHASNLHGKTGTKMSYDSMQTSNLSGNGHTSYIMNPATVEETVVEIGGISAETDTAGVLMNLVPKEGGNTFGGGLDGVYTNENFQSDNLTDRVRARGTTTMPKTQHLYDSNVYSGGPIKRDRLWFFGAARVSGTQNQVVNLFFNKTRGTPFYTPDPDQPAYRREWLRSAGGRLTWQASPRNKINVFADTQTYQVRGRGDNAAPEAHTVWSFWPAGLYQATWSSSVSSRLLLEAGGSLTKNPLPFTREQTTDIFGFVVPETDISIFEQSTGLRYNARSTYSNRNDMDRYVERFSASYVTGAHRFKTGVQLQQGAVNADTRVNQDVNYNFFQGKPSSIVQWATPYLNKSRIMEVGLYAQDQWVIQRLTINAGLRYESFNGWVPPQSVPAGRFVGAREYDHVSDVPDYKDLNPRLGAAFDLFGNGRTALKTSFGRYVGKLAAQTTAELNPLSRSINNVTRTWNDQFFGPGDPRSGNYVPDCNLQDFAANGECTVISNTNFGKLNPNATQYADNLIHGFGNRAYLWDLSAEVQQQIRSSMSVKLGYYRNWTDQFGAIFFNNDNGGGWPVGHVDNLVATPADFERYCITAPVDSRLPGGGGYPVCGLYDIVPTKFGQGVNLFARASEYDRPDGGKGKSRVSDFVSASMTGRFGGRSQVGASLDTGRIVEDNCFVIDSPQQLLNCRVVAPFSSQTQVKAYASYRLPAGFEVSGVFQNLSGVPYLANYTATNSEIAPSLHRNLAACGAQTVCTATTTVPLFRPMTQFEPRRTLVDVRMSKVFAVGGSRRLKANVDVYNLLNDGSVVNTNNAYGPSWLRPTGGPFTAGLADGRLFQFSAQLTF